MFYSNLHFWYCFWSFYQSFHVKFWFQLSEMCLRSDCVFQTATVSLMKEVWRISKKNSTSQPFYFNKCKLHISGDTETTGNYPTTELKWDVKWTQKPYLEISYYHFMGFIKINSNANVFRHMKTKASPRTCTNFLLYVCVSIHIFLVKAQPYTLLFIEIGRRQNPAAVTVNSCYAGYLLSRGISNLNSCWPRWTKTNLCCRG